MPSASSPPCCGGNNGAGARSSLARVPAEKTLFYQLAVSPLLLPLAAWVVGEPGIVRLDPLAVGSLLFQGVAGRLRPTTGLVLAADAAATTPAGCGVLVLAPLFGVVFRRVAASASGSAHLRRRRRDGRRRHRDGQLPPLSGLNRHTPAQRSVPSMRRRDLLTGLPAIAGAAMLPASAQPAAAAAGDFRSPANRSARSVWEPGSPSTSATRWSSARRRLQVLQAFCAAGGGVIDSSPMYGRAEARPRRSAAAGRSCRQAIRRDQGVDGVQGPSGLPRWPSLCGCGARAPTAAWPAASRAARPGAGCTTCSPGRST